MKPKVYLETTIPSLLTAWPSRDLVIAGQQQVTRDWWGTRRNDFQLFVSELVLEEAGLGDSAAAALRLEAVAGCALLAATKETQELARALLASRLIPPDAAADAAHIAVAAVHGMDFLLTWNCRHIANATLVEPVRAVCLRGGFPAPVICTPVELMIR
jgi:hypothetical protein